MFLNLALLPSSGPRFLPSPGSAASLGWPHLWLVRRWVAAAGPSLPSAPEGRLPELPRGWGGLPQMPPGLLRSVALPRVPGPLPDQPLPRAGLGSRPARWPQPYPREGAQPQKGRGGGRPGPSVSMTCRVPSARCSSPAGTPRCAPTRLRWLLPLPSAVFCFGPFCPSSRVRFVHVTKTYLIMEGKGVERPWAVKAASPSPGHAPCPL